MLYYNHTEGNKPRMKGAGQKPEEKKSASNNNDRPACRATIGRQGGKR